MSGSRHNPYLYQVHTACYLDEIGGQSGGGSCALADIPGKVLAELRDRGVDMLWTMGVWQRSPRGRKEALRHRDLREAYGRVLPGWQESDVSGSPYSIYGYRLEPMFGKDRTGLKKLRERLHHYGIRLILDFVPNHFALDHPWTLKYPGRFIRAGKKLLKEHRDWFFRTERGEWLAHGRDPYWGPWSDTVQVNLFAEEMRRALTDELLSVADLCDGVRCDMAMLLLNEVFASSWEGAVSEPAPKEEFWPKVIAEVKSRHPAFTFIAEVYWGYEDRLLSLGFDYVYDKELYDRFRDNDIPSLRGHLSRGAEYLGRAVHFIENHDEERALQLFGKERSLAAAGAMMTLPGMRFSHHGQLEGETLKFPIHLSRKSVVSRDKTVQDFYRCLNTVTSAEVFRKGEWSGLHHFPAASGIPLPVLSWTWRLHGDFRWVLINYSCEELFCDIPVGGAFRNHHLWEDLMKTASVLKQKSDSTLPVSFRPWEVRIIRPL